MIARDHNGNTSNRNELKRICPSNDVAERWHRGTQKRGRGGREEGKCVCVVVVVGVGLEGGRWGGVGEAGGRG